MTDFLDSLPPLDAATMLGIFVAVPLIPFFIAVAFVPKSEQHYKQSRAKNFLYSSVYVLSKHAGIIVTCNLIWSIIIACSQSVYVYNKLSLGSDITYYM